MDTPQVTPASLATAAAPVRYGDRDSVLGPAVDGGWWALGLAEPRHAHVLADVPMSREDTGIRTLRALVACGLRPGGAARLSDVDTMVEARAVAAACPDSRFARAVRAVVGQAVA
jgi:glycosyltransferase A (GT-A) superfamily protein (DUF2064 family)